MVRKGGKKKNIDYGKKNVKYLVIELYIIYENV